MIHNNTEHASPELDYLEYYPNIHSSLLEREIYTTYTLRRVYSTTRSMEFNADREAISHDPRDHTATVLGGSFIHRTGGVTFEYALRELDTGVSTVEAPPLLF